MLIHVYLSISISISISPSFSIYIYISFYIYIFLLIYLSIYLSIHPCIHLSIYMGYMRIYEDIWGTDCMHIWHMWYLIHVMMFFFKPFILGISARNMRISFHHRTLDQSPVTLGAWGHASNICGTVSLSLISLGVCAASVKIDLSIVVVDLENSHSLKLPMNPDEKCVLIGKYI